jgi:hypothetical protein
LVAPFVLGKTIDVNKNHRGKTEDDVECRQNIEEGADALRITERNAITSHKPGIEELVHLKR